MFDLPDPLFETFVEGKRLCLVCARQPASRALWTVNKQVVPLCPDCVADWNIYGYLILRRIKPRRLVLGILKYKLLHPFQAPSIATIWRDVRGLQEWARQMKKFM
jgi:hypothetical protein